MLFYQIIINYQSFISIIYQLTQDKMELLPEHEKRRIIAKAHRVKKIFKNPITNIIVFQTLGSLILAYGICVTQYLHPISRHVENPFWTFLISCFNFLAISIAGFFSGGHVNPSATIGLYVAGKVERKKIGSYFLSQFVGAILGTLIYFAFFQQNTQIYSQTPQFKQVIYDCISQIVGTFIFLFGVQLIVIRDYMKGQQFKYFFISLMLLVARYFTFRKGCLNPAVALAFQIFAAGSHQNFTLFYCVFGMILGQIIGAVLSGLFFTRFYHPLLEQIQKGQ